MGWEWVVKALLVDYITTILRIISTHRQTVGEGIVERYLPSPSIFSQKDLLPI